MRILITGVAGFIGSNLAERLLSEGHSITGIDNLSHGSIDNIESFADNTNFHFIKKDLTDMSLLNGYDIIVHLASEKIPRYTSSYNTLTRNTQMINNVIDNCLSWGSRLVFASTSDVYGMNGDSSFSEDSNLVLGRTEVKRWAYATSKIYAEHLIHATHDEFGLNYTIVRLFGCYGKNQNITWWGGPQGLFIQNCLENKSIMIHGTGEQKRCFTYIDDVIDGLMLCIEREEAINNTFNIGNPSSPISITDLAIYIQRLTQTDNEKIFIPYSTFGVYDDVMQRTPNIDKICTLLEFKPKISIEEGLRRTIEWQINKFNNGTSKI